MCITFTKMSILLTQFCWRTRWGGESERSSDELSPLWERVIQVDLTQIWERSGLQYTEQGGRVYSYWREGYNLVHVLHLSTKGRCMNLCFYFCAISKTYNFNINIRLGLSILVHTVPNTHTHTHAARLGLSTLSVRAERCFIGSDSNIQTDVDMRWRDLEEDIGEGELELVIFLVSPT